MTAQLAPAGWYDDPAGGGGSRYWDGSAWTRTVRGRDASRSTTPDAGPRRSSSDRLRDGHMRLNGVEVPLGTKSVPTASTPSRTRRPLTRAVAFAVLALALLAVVLAVVGAAVDAARGDTVTIQVTSDDEAPLVVTWSDGTDVIDTDLLVHSGWSAEFTPGEGAPYIVVESTGAGSVTCHMSGRGTSSWHTTNEGWGRTSCRLDR